MKRRLIIVTLINLILLALLFWLYFHPEEYLLPKIAREIKKPLTKGVYLKGRVTLEGEENHQGIKIKLTKKKFAPEEVFKTHTDINGDYLLTIPETAWVTPIAPEITTPRATAPLSRPAPDVIIIFEKEGFISAKKLMYMFHIKFSEANDFGHLELVQDNEINRRAWAVFDKVKNVSSQSVMDKLKEIISKHPESSYADDALFFIAQRQKPQEAIVTLQRLVSLYPEAMDNITFIERYWKQDRGCYRDDIVFKLGELYKRIGLYPSAIEYYVKYVKEYPQQERVEDALHNLLRLESGESKIQYGLQLLSQFPKSRYFKERRRDLASFLADTVEGKAGCSDEIIDKTVATCRTFIESYPKSREAKEVLIAIATVYRRSGRFKEAIQTYRELVKRFPEDRNADSWQWRIVDIYNRKLFNHPKALAEFEILRKKFPESTYDRDESYYKRLQKLADQKR